MSPCALREAGSTAGLWQMVGRRDSPIHKCALESPAPGSAPILGWAGVWVSQPCLSQPSLTHLGKVPQTGSDQSPQPTPCPV